MTDPNEEIEEGLPLEPEPEPEPEVAEGDGENASDDEVAKAASALKVELPPAKHGGAPYWCYLPNAFTFPRGKQVIFLKFKASWTDTPWKGEPIPAKDGNGMELDGNGDPVLYRQCVCWPINTADKKLALGRAMSDPNRVVDELAKQMVRVADGTEADWGTTTSTGVEMFWNEIGEKCRGHIIKMFTSLHVMNMADTRDFLENCIEVRKSGG